MLARWIYLKQYKNEIRTLTHDSSIEELDYFTQNYIVSSSYLDSLDDNNMTINFTVQIIVLFINIMKIWWNIISQLKNHFFFSKSAESLGKNILSCSFYAYLFLQYMLTVTPFISYTKHTFTRFIPYKKIYFRNFLCMIYLRKRKQLISTFYFPLILKGIKTRADVDR